MNVKNTKVKKRKLTLICVLHYLKLTYRSLLFILAAVMYVVGRIRGTGEFFGELKKEYWLLGVIWLVYVAEMACRFFPSRLESPGCQKQFGKNYIPTGESQPKLQSWKRTLAVALAWFALALLARWEITVHRHPERFSEKTNARLSCKNCEEKLCHHKKQLQGFLKKYKTRFFLPRKIDRQK